MLGRPSAERAARRASAAALCQRLGAPRWPPSVGAAAPRATRLRSRPSAPPVRDEVSAATLGAVDQALAAGEARGGEAHPQLAQPAVVGPQRRGLARGGDRRRSRGSTARTASGAPLGRRVPRTTRHAGRARRGPRAPPARSRRRAPRPARRARRARRRAPACGEVLRRGHRRGARTSAATTDRAPRRAVLSSACSATWSPARSDRSTAVPAWCSSSGHTTWSSASWCPAISEHARSTHSPKASARCSVNRVVPNASPSATAARRRVSRPASRCGAAPGGGRCRGRSPPGRRVARGAGSPVAAEGSRSGSRGAGTVTGVDARGATGRRAGTGHAHSMTTSTWRALVVDLP